MIASFESRCLEDMEGLVWLGVICIEVCEILEGCRFSLAHSGTITALNSSWTVTPLFFASEDIAANGFSFMLSMNLGTVKALPDESARSHSIRHVYNILYTMKGDQKPSHAKKKRLQKS